MRVVTFDTETISDSTIRGRLDVNEQELVVVATHDSQTGEYASYVKDDLPALWRLLESADLLVGFNCDTFDIPLLNRYYPGDLTRIPSLDLLSEVQKALGRRLRLQSLAEATLGAGKSGDGVSSMKWWREGKHDLVRAYCVEDVRLTRGLYDYALAHGSLKYKDLREIRDIRLDVSQWKSGFSAPAMTYTLPL